LLGRLARVNGQSFAGDGEVVLVDVKSGVFGNFELLGGKGRRTNSVKGVKKVMGVFESVDADALFGEGDREGGGVGAFFVAGLDGVVGNKPVVAAAALVFAPAVTPAGDVGFIGIFDTSGTAFERDLAGFGEVEKIFVAVVNETFGIDGLKVTGGDRFSPAGFNRDRFDPVEGVLEDELRTLGCEGENELVGEEGIGRGGTEIKKKGGVIGHEAMDFAGPVLAPGDEGLAILGVFVGAVIDTNIVWRGGDDEVDGVCRHLLHAFEAIGVVEIDHRKFLSGWGDLESLDLNNGVSSDRNLGLRVVCGRESWCSG